MFSRDVDATGSGFTCYATGLAAEYETIQWEITKVWGGGDLEKELWQCKSLKWVKKLEYRPSSSCTQNCLCVWNLRPVSRTSVSLVMFSVTSHKEAAPGTSKAHRSIKNGFIELHSYNADHVVSQWFRPLDVSSCSWRDWLFPDYTGLKTLDLRQDVGLNSEIMISGFFFHGCAILWGHLKKFMKEWNQR